jgi:hypothetical protein
MRRYAVRRIKPSSARVTAAGSALWLGMGDLRPRGGELRPVAAAVQDMNDFVPFRIFLGII